MPNPQPNSGSGVALLLAVAVGALAFGGGPKGTIPLVDPAHPAIVLGPDATAKLAAVRAIAAANPEVARRLGLMIDAAASMIRIDGSTIVTMAQVIAFVERAERLYVAGTSGVGGLPGVGAAMTAVLKSPDVFGATDGPLDMAKRKVAADALQAIAGALGR